MSIAALDASAQTLKADVYYLREKIRRLKDSAQVRTNPDLTLYISFLIHFLRDRESQIGEILLASREREPFPLPVLRQKIDVEDRTVDLLERLVEALERSIEVPPELYFMLREVFESFRCKTRFVVLAGVSLATTPLGNLIPEAAIPENVKDKLRKEPFAIIFAPPRFTKNPEYWPRIVHEAAHNIDLTLGITSQSIQQFGRGIGQLSLEMATSVVSLCREEVADLISTHYYGPSYGDSALLVFLRGEPMALPTHPVGTQRLSTIASELEFMKFHAQSQVFRDKIGQLGVEERHRDKVLRPHEVAKPLHTLLRTNVRKTSTKLRTILRPRDVVAGVGKIGKFIEYDYSTRRFVRLTPTNLPLRILFNAYRPKLESRTQPKFEESSEIHGWIMDSIRMSSIAQRPGFRDFYVEPNQIP